MLKQTFAAFALLGGTAAIAQDTGSRVEISGMQMYYEVSGSGATSSCFTALT